MLRNWERNGYRQYTASEIGRLRVIRMLRAFDEGQRDNLGQMLDTPRSDEDVYTAADQWLTALKAQEQRALEIIAQLETMIHKWG